METLDTLVKLASIGTAGVCIFAIFFMGTGIFKLSNDTTEIKASLMKKYMNTCIIIAIICTVSGVSNAFFNMKKVEIAENKSEALEEVYESGKASQVLNNPAAYRLNKKKIEEYQAELKSNPDNMEVQKKLIYNDIATRAVAGQ